MFCFLCLALSSTKLRGVKLQSRRGVRSEMSSGGLCGLWQLFFTPLRARGEPAHVAHVVGVALVARRWSGASMSSMRRPRHAPSRCETPAWEGGQWQGSAALPTQDSGSPFSGRHLGRAFGFSDFASDTSLIAYLGPRAYLDPPGCFTAGHLHPCTQQHEGEHHAGEELRSAMRASRVGLPTCGALERTHIRRCLGGGVLKHGRAPAGRL